MSDMAGVLARALYPNDDGKTDLHLGVTGALIVQRAVDALSDAGFGLVREKQAEAWDQGQRAWEDELLGKAAGVNPYRAAVDSK